MNGKDRAYNRRCREMAGSSPDWRMRSPSDEDRDNTTRSERGPLGAGGNDVAGGGRTQRRISSAAGVVVYGQSKRGTRAGAWRGWP